MRHYLIHPENEAYVSGQVERPAEVRTYEILRVGMETCFGTVMIIVLLIMGASSLTQGWQIGGVVFLLMGVLIALFVARQNRKVRAFYREGRKLEGKLLSLVVEEIEDSDGDAHTFTVVDVSFRTPDGRTVQGKRYYNTERGKLHPPPEEAVVSVFYRNDEEWEVL